MSVTARLRHTFHHFSIFTVFYLLLLLLRFFLSIDKNQHANCINVYTQEREREKREHHTQRYGSHRIVKASHEHGFVAWGTSHSVGYKINNVGCWNNEQTTLHFIYVVCTFFSVSVIFWDARYLVYFHFVYVIFPNSFFFILSTLEFIFIWVLRMIEKKSVFCVLIMQKSLCGILFR